MECKSVERGIECHKVSRLRRMKRHQNFFRSPEKETFLHLPPHRLCDAKPEESHDFLSHLETDIFLELPPKTLRSQTKARNSTRHTQKPQNKHFVRDFLQFRHIDTISNARLCNFPIDTAQPETRNDTLEKTKTRISCETSFNFDKL